VASPFVVRTFDPPLSAAAGKTVREVRRLGKRIVFVLDDELFLVIHLMIAGKVGLAAFDFPAGTLLLTEAATKKRASIHLARSLDGFRRGGIEPMEASAEEFEAALRRENHTLKRSLTDPRLFSGIGNAYSDEILHRARLSPLTLTQRLTSDEITRLFQATRDTLLDWADILRSEAGEHFPQ